MEVLELRDCGWCGGRLELLRHWTVVKPRIIGDDGEELRPQVSVKQATARCERGHWYGGAFDDVLLRREVA